MTNLDWGLLGLSVIIVVILWVIMLHSNNGAKMAIGMFLWTLFVAGNAHALTTATPRVIYEGTAAEVRLKGEWASAHKWKAVFLRRVYRFFSEGDDAVAIIAAPLNEPAGSRAIVFENEGLKFRRWIEIKKKAFPVSVVLFPALSKTDLELIAQDKAKLKQSTSDYSLGLTPNNFSWPMRNGNGCLVTSPFGVKRLNKKGEIIGRHWGVDCKAAEGDSLYAMGGGVVRLVGDFMLEGKTIVIDHGFGIYSLYMHLSEVKVVEGVIVKTGELVGKAGTTGRSSGPHLHWALKINGIDVDPIEFLKSGGAR